MPPLRNHRLQRGAADDMELKRTCVEDVDVQEMLRGKRRRFEKTDFLGYFASCLLARSCLYCSQLLAFLLLLQLPPSGTDKHRQNSRNFTQSV
jgi:hypothetical protein